MREIYWPFLRECLLEEDAGGRGPQRTLVQVSGRARGDAGTYFS